MDRSTPVRQVLHRAADVARMLGCSEWWVKEQARNRRIPYSWIGGSYRFTDQHVTEIVRLFEVRPAEARVPAQPRRATARAGDNEDSQVSYLKARTPRRARSAAQGQAA